MTVRHLLSRNSKYEFNIILFICLVVIASVKNVACNQPNIIFIIADDLGWNDVGFHGENDIPTPNIDALAYNGIVLNRHYTLPTCTPSRAAFLTGKYPFRYGIDTPVGAGVVKAVPVTEKLLPQYLKELGYSTHLIGKWHIGCNKEELLPFNRGFDNHVGYWNGYLTYNDSIHETDFAVGLDARRNMERYASQMSSKYLTDFFTDQSVHVIKSHNHSRPLFLQITHAAVHTGTAGNAKLPTGLLQVPDMEENDRTFAHISNPDRRLFAGMLKSLDESVGRVIQSLEEEGLLGNSLVVFISDNGGPTVDSLHFHGNTASNWPLRGTKYSFHEGGVRNVAALWSPLLRKGQVLENLMHITDWLPTLYFIAGGNMAKLPKELDGFNQWTTLDGSTAFPERDALLVGFLPQYNDEAFIQDSWKLVKVNASSPIQFSHIHHNRTSGDTSMYQIEQIQSSRTNVILSKYHEIETAKLSVDVIDRLRTKARVDCKQTDSKGGNCMDQYCLYNINEDPCEYKNIAATNPDKVHQLKKLLDHYKKELEHIKMQTGSFDPLANPIYWDGYWSAWKENDAKIYVNEALLVLTGTLLVLIYLNYLLVKKFF
ncbi:hypothetical protein M8J76_002340 [Diaphorina citri]|nr:hypothetical protein M8J76_002340 [Diaphorina citri]